LSRSSLVALRPLFAMPRLFHKISGGILGIC
jgi:hypothetical protein